MVHVITRKLEFDAGHRVYQHESKCNNLHGHRYVIELSVTSTIDVDKLDQLGRVIDFSVLKSVCGKWVDDNLDHGMILSKDDPLAVYFTNYSKPVYDACFFKGGRFVDENQNPIEQKHYIMDKNPTAENMAELLYKKFNELLSDYDITVTSIKLWETPNCYALYVE